MRDPSRLDYFYDELKKIHKENFPDWRFSQFISNVVSWIGTDIFYFEEDKMLEIFRAYASKGIKN